MKVKEIIRDVYVADAEKRLARLIALEVPQVIIKITQDYIGHMNSFTFVDEVEGYTLLLEYDVESYKLIPGREGNMYIEFIGKGGREILYFHNDEQGRFITLRDDLRRARDKRETEIDLLKSLFARIEVTDEQGAELEDILGETTFLADPSSGHILDQIITFFGASVKPELVSIGGACPAKMPIRQKPKLRTR